MKTAPGIWALGPMVIRFVPGGYQSEYAGGDDRRPRPPRGDREDRVRIAGSVICSAPDAPAAVTVDSLSRKRLAAAGR